MTAPRDPRGRQPGMPELEDGIRRSLAARASTVHAEPDPLGLAGRIAASGARASRRGKAMVVASVVLVSALAGGVLAGALTPQRPQSTYLSSKGGNQGGPLPTGPGSGTSTGGAQGGGSNALHGNAASSPTVEISRVASDGDVVLRASGAWLAPVAVMSGDSSPACYSQELVSTVAATTAASGSAPVTGASRGVVGLEALSPSSVEVIDSGQRAAASDQILWWATVAVGDRVARVAAEAPSGLTDAARPSSGIAVVGGTVPASDSSRYFSVVAETGSGQSLSSIGFQLGWGARVVGDAAASPAKGCALPDTGVRQGRSTGSQPSSPLLAASSVVAAFHEAYGADDPGGLAERLDAVHPVSPSGWPAPLLGGAPAGAAAVAPATADTSVVVAEVAFLSAGQAAVIYRIGSGVWMTGRSSLGPAGRWEVDGFTFCRDVLDASAGGLNVAQRSTRGLGPVARLCQNFAG